MTINNLLKTIEVKDHRTRLRYPDGSGGEDFYTVTIYLDGHGKILNAKVKEAKIRRGSLCIIADGVKEGVRL